LKAALAPAEGDWLYYVLADCEGHHAFSKSYDEFLENKAAYQSLSC
jgi:cell division protein YceG involved in septum cleavage